MSVNMSLKKEQMRQQNADLNFTKKDFQELKMRKKGLR